MNALIAMTLLLGGVLFGTYTTWNQYKQGKTEIERNAVAPQEVQRFLATLYASLSNQDSCKQMLKNMVVPATLPDEIAGFSLTLGNTLITQGAKWQTSSLTKLKATIDLCAPTCAVAATTHNLTVEWEITHSTSKRKSFGTIRNLFVTPDTVSSIGINACSYTPQTTASGGAAFDCARFGGASPGPLGECQTQNQALSALGIVPQPSVSNVSLQLTQALMADLTPPSGSPAQVCGSNTAAQGYQVNPTSGYVSLVCAAATPSPTPSPTGSPPSGPTCIPRPVTCLSCWVLMNPTGTTCYSSTWMAGVSKFVYWVGPVGTGSSACCSAGTGSGSCSALMPSMCHSTVSGGGPPCPDHRCR